MNENSSVRTKRLQRILRLGVLAIIVCISFITFHCQTPVQPTSLIVGDGFKTTVTVRDQSAAAVVGAQVSYGIQHGSTALADNAFTPMAPDPTNSTGNVFAATIPVPIADSNVKVVFRVVPPNDPTFRLSPTALDTARDTVRICSSTDISVMFQRHQAVTTCDSQTVPGLSLSTRVPDRLGDTSCTSSFVNQTGSVLTFQQLVGLPSNVTEQMKIGRMLTPTPFPVNVAIGDTFQICFILSLSAPLPTQAVDTTATITLVGASVANANCFKRFFTLRKQITFLQTCSCPTNAPTIFYPSPVGFDSVCVGSSSTVHIPLSSITNNNSGSCNLTYTLVSPSSVAGITVTSINNQFSPNSTVLSPPSTMGDLVLTFSPTAPIQYFDTIVYNVQLKNMQDGSVSQCNTLKIIYRGIGSQSICAIDTAGSSLLNAGVPYTIKNCVGLDNPSNDRTICIQNTGLCPLPIKATVADSLFRVVPDTATIQAHSSVCLTVHFVAADSNVWPKGRTFAAIHDFNTVLTINGCAANSFNITGNADTTCQGCLDEVFHQWGESNAWYDFAKLNTQINQLQKANANTNTDRYVYINSINTIAKTAVLVSDYATWDSVVPNYAGALSICGNNPVTNYLNPWTAASGRAYSKVMQPGDSLQVSEGDVILFSISYASGAIYHGVIWVKKIDKDQTNAFGLSEALLEIAYPL